MSIIKGLALEDCKAGDVLRVELDYNTGHYGFAPYQAIKHRIDKNYYVGPDIINVDTKTGDVYGVDFKINRELQKKLLHGMVYGMSSSLFQAQYMNNPIEETPMFTYIKPTNEKYLSKLTKKALIEKIQAMRGQMESNSRRLIETQNRANQAEQALNRSNARSIIVNDLLASVNKILNQR